MNIIDIRAECIRLSRLFHSAGITQSQLSIELDANQSQISRILSGKCKRPSKVFRRLCNYAKSIKSEHPLNPASNSVMLEAIASIWDGSEEHAIHIATAIRSLKPLSEYLSRR